jgi:secretion/DNA translocation related CpaE-like protein
MPANIGVSKSVTSARRGRPGRIDHCVPLIGVIGGCGGAGASTLAVSLALAALGGGRRTILFDADPFGGGLEPLLALGTVCVEQSAAPDEVRAWPHGIYAPRRAYGAVPGGPRPDLALVAWGSAEGRERIPVSAMRNALRILRAGADLVVVDLPRVIDDATQLVLAEATHTLVVAPVSERAAIATARLLPMLSIIGPGPQIVARLPSRDELTAREFAGLLGVPLAGVLRPNRGSLPKCPVGRQLGGRSSVSLAKLSRRLVEGYFSDPKATDGRRTRVAA